MNQRIEDAIEAVEAMRKTRQRRIKHLKDMHLDAFTDTLERDMLTQVRDVLLVHCNK